MGRRFLDLEADVGFEVWAQDLNSLFEEAALAMYEVMVDVGKIDPKVERHVKLSAPNLEMLLQRWLSELLFITEVEKLVFSKFEVSVEDEGYLSGKALGDFIDLERHDPRTEVKAVTYHRLSVVKEGDLWKGTVVLDI